MIRFVLQSYLKTILGAAFSLYVLSFADGKSTLNAILAILFVVILAAFPVFFAIVLHKNQENLQTEEMKQKIGSLYLGMRTANKWQRLYSSVFLARRFIYAVLTITCINNPNILIHVFLLTNILYIVYVGLVSPNDTVMSRRMEIFNESGLQLVTYHLALFPLAHSTDGEFDWGWSMVGTVGFVFAANLGVMVLVSI